MSLSVCLCLCLSFSLFLQCVSARAGRDWPCEKPARRSQDIHRYGTCLKEEKSANRSENYFSVLSLFFFSVTSAAAFEEPIHRFAQRHCRSQTDLCVVLDRIRIGTNLSHNDVIMSHYSLPLSSILTLRSAREITASLCGCFTASPGDQTFSSTATVTGGM